VFALVGLQLYIGVLKRKCVWNGPANLTNNEYRHFIGDSSKILPQMMTRAFKREIYIFHILKKIGSSILQTAMFCAGMGKIRALLFFNISSYAI